MKNQKDRVWMLKTLLPDSVTFSAWAGYCAFCLDAHTSSLDLSENECYFLHSPVRVIIKTKEHFYFKPHFNFAFSR